MEEEELEVESLIEDFIDILQDTNDIGEIILKKIMKN